MTPTPASRGKRTAAAVAVAVLAALLGGAGTAAAGHLDQTTARCTYEVGEVEPGVLSADFAADDPLGLTADGAVNKTVCAFHTPDSDPGESSQLGPAHVLLDGVITIDGQYGQVQASIVDDVWGSGALGGSIFADLNHDHMSGLDGEPVHSFCGTSPVLELGQDTDGDGHADFGWGVVVSVNGYVSQALNCDPVEAPTSTTGGVLDPAGGIFVTVSG